MRGNRKVTPLRLLPETVAAVDKIAERRDREKRKGKQPYWYRPINRSDVLRETVAGLLAAEGFTAEAEAERRTAY
jgi:hypothetical protein